jgi:hypothetical protein
MRCMRTQLIVCTLSRRPCDGYEVRGNRVRTRRWPRTAVWFMRRGTGPILFFHLIMMLCSDLRERELTTRQAALIDSAFEEGQYESGIAMLEQLCSPTNHPSR